MERKQRHVGDVLTVSLSVQVGTEGSSLASPGYPSTDLELVSP